MVKRKRKMTMSAKLVRPMRATYERARMLTVNLFQGEQHVAIYVKRTGRGRGAVSLVVTDEHGSPLRQIGRDLTLGDVWRALVEKSGGVW